MTAVAGDVDRRDSTSIRRSHLAILGQHLAAIGCLAFLVRLLASGWDAGYATYFPDSSSFAAVATRGPLTGRFWFDERPVGLPLLFWLCGRSARLLVFVQSALYVVAFVALAGAAARSLRTWPARIVAVVVVACIGVQPRFALWNTHVLSESLGISVGVGMLAAWWWLVVRPSADRAWLAVGTAAAWLVLRDSHVLPLVLVGVPAMLVASWRWLAASADVRRVLRLGAVLVLALAVYVTASQGAADRNIYPVINNIGQRILPDDDMREWFVDRGLPLDDNLLTHSGRHSFDDDSALLEDPSLEEFRQWAATSGQRWELVSFVVRAPFWLGELGDQLDALLSEDYADYDGFEVGPHLPTPPGMLAGPRSAAALAVGLVLAVLGLAVAFADRRLRTRVVVVGLFLVGALVDFYLSFAGDSLEIGRHVVGPMSRVSIALGLAFVLGAESLACRHRRLVASGEEDDDDDDDHDLEADRRSVRVRPAALVTSALITLVGAAGLFANELRSQDYDPLYMKVLVDRANSLGHTYYESGLHNKGPLEPFVYQVASWITSDDGYWFAISLFVILTALVVGVAAGLTARAIGVSRRGGYAVGAAVVVHLVLSRSDYAGVLYSRNMVVALLAAAWSVSLYAPFWRTRRRSTMSALVIGALIGLAVQTLPASAFSAAVVAVFALVQMRIRVAAAWRHHAARLTGATVVVVGLAPMWYAVRGRFDEFWGGWWIYARYQSEGFGRSVPRQFGRAWDEAYAYYIDRPALVLVLAAFVVFTVVRWHRIRVRQRVLRVVLLGWILAAWVELALGQRYSTHYFIVLAAPTALVLAVVVADTWAVLRRFALTVPPRAGEWLVAAAIAVSAIAGGATELRKGFVGAGEFRGVPAFATARRNQEQGPVRSMRAALDIISDDGDPLLAWTDKPWTYLQWDRVAATRYIWSTFLTGQIYLGRAGAEFVPPHTAEWFADDIAETNPVTYLQDAGQPPPVPLVADLIAADFGLVYDAPAHDLFARHEVAAQLITPAEVDVPWRPEVLAAGWTAGPGALSSPSGGSPADQAMLAGSCRRLDGFLEPASTAEVRFVIDDRSPTGETQILGFAGDSAWSATEAVELERTEWVFDGDDAEQPRAFSVVVGDRSAVLIVDGMIRAGVRTRGDVSLAVRATDQPIELTGLHVSVADFVPGC